MLRVIGSYNSSNNSIDLGVRGLSFSSSGTLGGFWPYIYAYSGANGGVAAYILSPEGELIPFSSQMLPSGYGLAAQSGFHIAQMEAGRVLLTEAADARGIWGWLLNAGGEIAGEYRVQLPAGFDGKVLVSDQRSDGDAPTFVVDASNGLVASVSPNGRAQGLSLSGDAASNVTGISQVVRDGKTYLLLSNKNADGTDVLSSYLYDEANNRLALKAQLDQTNGFSVSDVSVLTKIETGGHNYIIVAASASSSISVFALGADGGLSLVDHVIDSRYTRFANLKALDAVTIGNNAYIAVGGGDDGITLFQMLPDGLLTELATIEDTTTTSLSNISSIKIVPQGGKLSILAGGETERGVSVLEWNLGSSGMSAQVNANVTAFSGSSDADVLLSGQNNQHISAGAGNDILVAKHNNVRLSGGAGADIFLVRQGASNVTIADFESGSDRFDPSGWPNVRDISQFTTETLSNGVKINFLGYSATIISQNGRSLSLDDVLGAGDITSRIAPSVLLASSEGGSRAGVGDLQASAGTPDPIPAIRERAPEPENDNSALLAFLESKSGQSTLASTPQQNARNTQWVDDPSLENESTQPINITNKAQARVLYGAAGSDYLKGGHYSDVFYTGNGDDIVRAGRGNDKVFAAGGNNDVWANRGDDILRAGSGDDNLCGGMGNDQIEGGDGENTLWAGDGDDIVTGGNGSERLGGGPGNDIINAHDGNDLVYGGGGADIITGGTGNDRIWSGRGNDIVAGGDGDDFIATGFGDNHVWGGSGADQFVFYKNSGHTHIRDFDASEGDRILLGHWIFGDDVPAVEELIESYQRTSEYGAVLFFEEANAAFTLHGHHDLSTIEDYITIF